MSRPSPLVSVVVPCHNHAWSIGRTLRTISTQHYDRIEVVVVDDGSTDSSAAIVREHQDSDPRIRLIQQPQRGLAAARNRGIAETTGKYAAPIDADDLWHPQNLAKQVAALEHDDASLSYALSVKIDLDDRLLPFKRPTPRSRLDFEELLDGNVIGNGSAAVFRRRDLLAVGGFDETMRQRDAEGAEDWKVSLLLTAQAPAVVVPEFLVAYRIYSSSMSRRDPLRQMCAALTVLEDVRDAMPSLPRSAYRRARTRSITRQILDCLPYCSPATAGRLLALAYLQNPLWYVERPALALPVKLAWNMTFAPLRQGHRAEKHGAMGGDKTITFTGENFQL